MLSVAPSAAARSSAPQVRAISRGCAGAYEPSANIAFAVSVATLASLTAPVRHAGLRFERIEIMADALEIGRAIDLGDHERVEARLHDRREIIEREPGVERIDAHDEHPGPLRVRLDEPGDMGAGAGLFRGRDGIFEVENEGVGPAIPGACKLAFGIAGNEQERAQSHVAFRDARGAPGRMRHAGGVEVSAQLQSPDPYRSAFATDIAPRSAVRFVRPCSRDRRR